MKPAIKDLRETKTHEYCGEEDVAFHLYPLLLDVLPGFDNFVMAI